MAHPIHKHMHTHITKHNVKAAVRDDKAHIDYLKRDVLWDNKHGHSDINMTADEKHISKLAGDIKHDKKKEGLSRNTSSPLNTHGGPHPGEVMLGQKDLDSVPSKRAKGLGSIDFAKKAGTTSMPDKDYEGGQDELDFEAAAKEGLDMGFDMARNMLKYNAIDDITQGDGKADWQKVVNAKRAAGIGYQTEYQTDENGNTISGLRFDDGTFLPD
tara:strand:+ start:4197 stop:4838 length:642 start_codon:yes stop_codon:yes gene_type:complete